MIGRFYSFHNQMYICGCPPVNGFRGIIYSVTLSIGKQTRINHTFVDMCTSNAVCEILATAYCRILVQLYTM